MPYAFRFLSLVLAATLTTAMPFAPVRAREAVAFSGQGSAGTIVVRTKERRLYFVTAQGRAIRYTVGVGRADKQWFGMHLGRQQAHPSRLVAARRDQTRPSELRYKIRLAA